jgi:hypothetical protein
MDAYSEKAGCNASSQAELEQAVMPMVGPKKRSKKMPVFFDYRIEPTNT